MITKVLFQYNNSFNDLSNLIEKTRDRSLLNEDSFFTDNINFFCKSYLVLTCSYLESYLKDSAWIIISETNYRLAQNPISYNILKWSMEKDKKFKEVDFKYESTRLSISKKDINDDISGNIYRTLGLFKKLGINLDSDSNFEIYKDEISSIVTKRNNILHHNDDASDVSFKDILDSIKVIKKYISVIDKLIIKHLQPALTDIIHVAETE